VGPGDGAFLIEDDYDSEYRFDGRPIPALQGWTRLDPLSFWEASTRYFSVLAVGYLVLPPALLDPLLVLRLGVDLHPPSLDQAILCDFMTEAIWGGTFADARHVCGKAGCFAARGAQVFVRAT